ncbi:MAG: DUF2339 domain-containing protein [Candidatus Omnitrophica bacterium]|nr:DUF2339 domain-containing protein [Candidatus Omnitrophota bacterium]
MMNKTYVAIKGLRRFYHDEKVTRLFMKLSDWTHEKAVAFLKDNDVITIKTVPQMKVRMFFEELKRCGYTLIEEPSSGGGYVVSVYNDEREELKVIKDEISFLTVRVQKLEEKLKQKQEAIEKMPDLPEVEEKPLTDVTQTKEMPPIAEEKYMFRPPAAPSLQKREPEISEPKERLSFEAKIGRVWLNRLGVVTLVMGVAFLVGYASRHFLLSPLGRSTIALAISVGLIGLGRHLIKKEGYYYFAIGTLGGGWASLYFVTYALYRVPAIQVIYSPTLDFLCLLGVTAYMIVDSLTFNSRVLTVMAHALGFLTLLLNPASLFTLGAALLLMISLFLVSYAREWKGLALIGVAGVYAAHIAWLHPQIYVGPGGFIDQFIFSNILVRHLFVGQWWYSAMPGFQALLSHINLTQHHLFLCIYWIAFSTIPYILSAEDNRMRETTNTVTLVTMFATTALLHATALANYPEYVWLAMSVFGALYAIKKVCLVKIGRESYEEGTDSVLALSLFTYAIVDKCTGIGELLLLAIEAYLLVEVGVRLKDYKYRVFATAVAIITCLRFIVYGYNPDEILILGLSKSFITAVVLAITTFACARRLEISSSLLKEYEKKKIGIFHGLTCVFLALGAIGEFSGINRILAITVALVIFNEMEMWGKWFAYRLASIISGGLASMMLLGDVIGGRWPHSWHADISYAGLSQPFLLSCLCLTGFYCCSYRIKKNAYFPTQESLAFSYYSLIWAAMVLGFFIIVPEFDNRWYSLVWGIEGFILLCTGLLIRVRHFRYGGLAFFSIVLIKLFFVDIIGLPIVYKIISFLALGAALLSASFFYSRFKALFSDEKNMRKLS